MSSETRKKVGVILPTYNRPDLLRSCFNQLLAQSHKPDLICVHQNGIGDNYSWCVQDIDKPTTVWMHTPNWLPQTEWYRRPLEHLIREGCTHYFWVDHDDILLSNHIAVCLDELDRGYDFRISSHVGILVTRPDSFHYESNVLFDDVHAPGGMTSSAAFTRDFAISLRDDLQRYEPDHDFADQVLAYETMPRFRCLTSHARTTIYFSHAASVSSRHWAGKVTEETFKKFPV
jgi:hypothetical protein